MSLISFTQLVDGSTAVNAAATNTPLSTIYNEFNGNIDNNNIKAGAAIAGSKISYASVSIPYKFSVYGSVATTLPSGSLTKIRFNSVEFDTGSNYDATTNFRFTAPVTGFYRFEAAVGQATAAANVHIVLYLYKNGSEFKRLSENTGTSAADNNVLSGASPLMQLSASDYIEIYYFQNQGSSGASLNGANYTWFSGEFVCAT